MRRRSGFTLIEMLVVMVGLASIMIIGANLIVEMRRLEREGAEDDTLMVRRFDLADRFRADVRNAVALPLKDGGYAAGDDCILLKMPGEGLVVWRLQGGEAIRREFGPDGRDVRKTFPLGAENAQAAFGPADPEGRTATLRLLGKRVVMGRREPGAIEIVAALGGERP